ncbi:MAG: hypothetical protein KAY59_05205 [Acidobacteria bacterium]|nr:hypothetical protein [Acidobacteriota bacterium]
MPLMCLAALVAAVLGAGTGAGWMALAVAIASSAWVCPHRWRGMVLTMTAAALCAAHGAEVRRVALDPPLFTALERVLDDRQASPVLLTGLLHEDASVDADGVRLTIDVERINIDGGGWEAVADARRWGWAARRPPASRAPGCAGGESRRRYS